MQCNRFATNINLKGICEISKNTHNAKKTITQTLHCFFFVIKDVYSNNCLLVLKRLSQHERCCWGRMTTWSQPHHPHPHTRTQKSRSANRKHATLQRGQIVAENHPARYTVDKTHRRTAKWRCVGEKFGVCSRCVLTNYTHFPFTNGGGCVSPQNDSTVNAIRMIFMMDCCVLSIRDVMCVWCT